MIIVPGKEHSQCDVSGMDVTFRREPQRPGTQNAALPAGLIPPSIQRLTPKRDSSHHHQRHRDTATPRHRDPVGHALAACRSCSKRRQPGRRILRPTPLNSARILPSPAPFTTNWATFNAVGGLKQSILRADARLVSAAIAFRSSGRPVRFSPPSGADVLPQLELESRPPQPSPAATAPPYKNCAVPALCVPPVC
jgi:hypothetical protein